MFSVMFASAFLPFLPMMPIHLLIQNLLYDISQTTIPFDRMDPEFLKKPRKWEAGNIRRFNMFTTAVVRGVAAPGYSSGEVMRKMENIARTHLPENIGVEWSGLSYQEKKAEGQLGLVLTLVFLFVFLFLAALYESWLVPVAVLLSLPVAALGAYLGILGFGLENDIYFQIGLVTLIGLAAELGFCAMLLTGHIGKLIKVAGGIMNTHSHEGDCRMELLAAAGIRENVSLECLKKILDCVTTEEALAFIDAEGKKEEVMEDIMGKIDFYLKKRAAGRLQIACIVYSNTYGLLGMTAKAEELLRRLL
jgi:hypothetical protein